MYQGSNADQQACEASALPAELSSGLTGIVSKRRALSPSPLLISLFLTTASHTLFHHLVSRDKMEGA